MAGFAEVADAETGRAIGAWLDWLAAERRASARELARLLELPEREIEEHLAHLIRTLRRDPARTLVMEPSRCDDCGFVFRERTRLTKPSRCPRCRSEAVLPPRFGIEVRSEANG